MASSFQSLKLSLHFLVFCIIAIFTNLINSPISIHALNVGVETNAGLSLVNFSFYISLISCFSIIMFGGGVR
uniref:Phospholipase A2 n=1 Tax=Solanum tuberosum TaxID=4113 RepID=M1CXU1_SOLTU